jgi:1A family penicillin-binding protein
MASKKSTKTRSRRAPKTRKVRAPKHQPKQRRPLRNFLALVVLIVILGGVGLFISVDRRVRARISSLHGSSLPVVYSAPLDLSGLVSRIDDAGPGQTERLREVLLDRRYSEVTGAPSRAGEFSMTKAGLSVFTRPYRNSSGAQVKSRKVTLALNEPARERVLLEPQVISYFNASEVRASTFTPLAQIPKVMQQAVISIEDERFYDHFGLDLISIARALFTNLLAGRLVQGGSTLTQQLAKNLFLSPKRTISRKLMEIPTALSLEYRLNKDQLLELYLNEVYLGQEGSVAIHGMPEAANALFGKKIGDIAPEEAALLAGIIKAPSRFNPRKYPERARERRDIVLGKMYERGVLTQEQYELARKQPVRIIDHQEHRRIAPYYASALEAELEQTIDINSAPSGGLAIYTGLDLGMQRCAEAAIEHGAKIVSENPKLKDRKTSPEFALVALEPYSGLIKAWVGGKDFGVTQFNRVNQGLRQIGSTIKPFLYLTALDGSLNSYKVASAVSILEDQPHEVKLKHQAAWNPENYDHEFRGDVTLRYALENSLNMPALYIADRIGLAALRRTLTAFRLADAVQQVPSLALGALDTNLLRLTAAYGALANAGIYIQPRLYVSVLDEAGDKLATSELVEERVADDSATYVLTNILQGVLSRGTGKGARSAGFTRDAAGKTGTSNDARDAWFVGFTPNLVAGVWVGFDDNSQLGLTGGAAAAPIWGEFMRCSSSYLPSASFVAPAGISFIDIDARTGGRATDDCPRDERITEVFVKGTEPKSVCALHPADGTPASQQRYDPSGRGARGGFWRSLFGN